MSVKYVIFDACFSPKSSIVANDLETSITLELVPFEELELLNPNKVRNMCKAVFYNADATVSIIFNVGAPLEQEFVYLYNQKQSIEISLAQSKYDIYKQATNAHFTVKFSGQDPISFGVQSLRFLKQDFSNCMQNVYAEFSNHVERYLHVNLKPQNCDINMSSISVHVLSNSHKIKVNPCMSQCKAGQYGQTTSFGQTTMFGQSTQNLVGDELSLLSDLLNDLENNLFLELDIEIIMDANVIQEKVEYNIVSDTKGCSQTMTEQVIYNYNDVRTLYYGSSPNNFTCSVEPDSNIRYEVIISNSTHRQVYSYFEPYTVFQIRSGYRFIGPAKITQQTETDILIYDLLFTLFDENQHILRQFSRHGVASIGCIKDGLIVKYSDKICVRMDYMESQFCKNRVGQYVTAVRFYDEPNDDRTQRKYFGNFIQTALMNYSTPEKTQQFCFSCDQFDPTTTFTGNTCQEALSTFGPLVAKSAPKFTFKTKFEYAAFDYTAVSYEWKSAFQPAWVVFGVIVVLVIVMVAIFFKK